MKHEYKGFNIEEINNNFYIGINKFRHLLFAKKYIDKIHMQDEAYQDDQGVWRWETNDRVPFSDMLEAWGLDEETLKKCVDARDEENSKSIAEYKKQMENYVPSDEERFEMQAAFGEGAEVVNVITGKKIQL